MKARANGEAASPSVEELLDFAQETNLSEVAWERGGKRIAFKRNLAPPPPPPPPAPPTPVESPPPATRVIPSPMVGTFLRSAKDRPPLVVEGSVVSVGQRIAVIEAMQIPKDVIAAVAGRIVKIFVDNGRPVEYGQPLFEIDAAGGA